MHTKCSDLPDGAAYTLIEDIFLDWARRKGMPTHHDSVWARYYFSLWLLQGYRASSYLFPASHCRSGLAAGTWRTAIRAEVQQPKKDNKNLRERYPAPASVDLINKVFLIRLHYCKVPPVTGMERNAVRALSRCLYHIYILVAFMLIAGGTDEDYKTIWVQKALEPPSWLWGYQGMLRPAGWSRQGKAGCGVQLRYNVYWKGYPENPAQVISKQARK